MNLYFGDGWPFCSCGNPVTLRLYVGYSYPRTECLPEAGDPWRVHGGGYSMWTCGNPQCEPDALLACRERIINDHLSGCMWIPLQEAGAQMAGLEIRVAIEAGAGIGGFGDEGEAA